VLLEDQDRTLWNRALIAEGLVLVEKALHHGASGALPGAGRHRRGPCPRRARRRHGLGGDRAAAPVLETLQPSPVIMLNRAVAVAKARGPEAALGMIEPLAERRSGYFHFLGVKAALLRELGRAEEARAAFDRAIARQHRGGSSSHPPAPRPSHEGQRAARRLQGRHLTLERIFRRAVGLPSRRTSLERSIDRTAILGRSHHEVPVPRLR
jgi:hypothetical protein